MSLVLLVLTLAIYTKKLFIWCSCLYGYSGYGIGFDRRSSFSFPGNGLGQNVLIFGVDMSSSSHIDNKTKNILVLGKGPTQGLEHALTAEKMYSISFTVTNKKMFKLALQWSK